MLSPEILTVLWGMTPNTNVAWLPSIKSWLVPGPEIVMFLTTTSPPLVSVIVPLTAKVILSPSCATASAWRSEPAPLSFVLVTVMMAAPVCLAVAQSNNTLIRAKRIRLISAAAAQRINPIKTRGLKKADRKVDLFMDRKNVSFGGSLFNQNGGNVESNRH